MCVNRGIVFSVHAGPVIRCVCDFRGLPITHSNFCPMRAIVQRLTSEGLAGLGRCRAANCGMMHRVNGAITCVGMQGKKCGWLAKWGRVLNREEEFACGGYDCPHWLPSGEHSGQDNRPKNDQDATEENKSTATAEKLT